MIIGIPKGFDWEYEPESLSLSNEGVVPQNVVRIDYNDYECLNKCYENDLQYLNQTFQRAMDIHTEEVQDIINKEKERIRRIEEQKRREREELERKRREQEQEELRRKQEEERRRKEEQERRLQEEREKKEREEAAKQKKIQEQKEKEEKLQKEAEEQKKLESQAQEADKLKDAGLQFLAYKQQIKEFKESIVNVVNDDKQLKKSVGVLRRKINPKFGQLSTSFRQLVAVTQEIIQLLNSARGSEIVFKFLLNFVAKAIVSQAETEIVVQPNAAVPLATMTSFLLEQFPELNSYLMARLVKKCPLVIGYTCSIDTEEGRLRMGWKRSKSTGKWEESDKYDERVAGICSLFSALTKLNKPPYPISMSWTFLARIANTPGDLITNVHFFCIANWWEACGKTFIGTYKNQAIKLLKLLAYELTNGKNYPAATRLKILAEEGIHPNIKSLKEMTN